MIEKNNHAEISIARRIKQLRLAKGLTQKTFADSLGIVQGYLSGIERGKKIPSYTLLMALCHIYGVREEWLFGGTGTEFAEMQLQREHLPEGFAAKIPLLKSIPEGFPDEISTEAIGEYICLPEIPEGSFAIIADGDFMAPTIREGDLVIFKPGSDVSNRSVVLLTNRWGEMILRRYRIKDEEGYFSPENTAYAPFKPDTNTRIFGTVINVWRNIKI